MITYNNNQTASNLLTFSNVHNIYALDDEILGTNCQITLSFSGSLYTTVTADTQYNITILDETISNVMQPTMATNKRFYISQYNSDTAASVCMALRNCDSLSADFNIILSGTNVVLLAKSIGAKTANMQVVNYTDIPSAYITITVTDGSAYSDLFKSKVYVDIYKGEEDTYVTTLAKNAYTDGCRFDVGSVLATFSNPLETEKYKLKMSTIYTNGGYLELDTKSGTTTVGYVANGSPKYIQMAGTQFLFNDDNTILYNYGGKIEYAVLVPYGTRRL